MKKRKFNIFKFILFILIIYLLYYLFNIVIDIPIKSITVINNNYYSDEEIIEASNLSKYPSYLLYNNFIGKNKLEKLDLIIKAKINKKLFFNIVIDVSEIKVLYYNKENNKYMCSDLEYRDLDIDNIYPSLVNHIPDSIEKKFASALGSIDNNVINKISEIEYSITNYDDERFLFYMNDTNNVYINVDNMNKLNTYNDIVSKLNNKKGILYLDSGNYFEVK